MIRSIINKVSFPDEVPQYDYMQEYPEMVRKHTIQAHCKAETIYSALVRHGSSRRLIIYCHGNAETIHFTVPMLQWYSSAFEANFVTYDYEGCGLSTGRSSQEALIRAADCIYNEYSAEFADIMVWGRSIGSVGAMHLGARHQLPTIIESGLASAYHVVFENVRTNCGNQFMNVELAHKIDDLTIIHGTDDEVVPFRNAQCIFDAWCKHCDHQTTVTANVTRGMDLFRCGKCAFFIIKGAHHNDIEQNFRDQFALAIQMTLCGYRLE